MDARADTAEQRFATYARLSVRNRIIAILRIGLPVLGVLVFLIFAMQIFLASLGPRFGIGRVSFSGDTIIVDTPSYSGVMANGDVYRVSAEGAQTAVSNLNVINLKNPTLVLTKPGGSQMTAKAAASAFETLSQVMTVKGTAEVSDSDGNRGTLNDISVNLPGQTLKARGRARIALANGMVIDAARLDYNARTSIWDFGRATVQLPTTPGADDTEDAP